MQRIRYFFPLTAGLCKPDGAGNGFIGQEELFSRILVVRRISVYLTDV